jgi:hypothetical protein
VVRFSVTLSLLRPFNILAHPTKNIPCKRVHKMERILMEAMRVHEAELLDAGITLIHDLQAVSCPGVGES